MPLLGSAVPVVLITTRGHWEETSGVQAESKSLSSLEVLFALREISSTKFRRNFLNCEAGEFCSIKHGFQGYPEQLVVCVLGAVPLGDSFWVSHPLQQCLTVAWLWIKKLPEEPGMLNETFQSFKASGMKPKRKVLRVFCRGLLLGQDLKCLCFGHHKAGILGELIIPTL